MCCVCAHATTFRCVLWESSNLGPLPEQNRIKVRHRFILWEFHLLRHVTVNRAATHLYGPNQNICFVAVSEPKIYADRV